MGDAQWQEHQRKKQAEAELLKSELGRARETRRTSEAMTRPHCVSLSDHQLRLVRQHAAQLPVELRDRYLRVIADGLTGTPSDSAVVAAVNRALDHLRAFQEAKP